jgi:hypothetical protein
LASSVPSFLDDLRQIGQLLLDAPAVSAYLRGGRQGARVVAWEPGVPHPTWSLLGAPVQFVEGAPEGAFLLPDIAIEGRQADANWWLMPERKYLHGAFSKGDRGWSLTSVELR